MLPDILKALQPWLAALGGIGLFATILVGASYYLFRVLGSKWLDAKFEERLANYKHEQQKELEQLKFEINSLMDRTVKLHQREFDVLPEAWGLVNDAFVAMEPIGIGFHQYPDLNRMTEPQIESLLEESELDNWQKDELRKVGNKTDYYRKATAPLQVVKADKTRAEFSRYLAKNGIFIPGPMKGKFKAIDALMWDALIERRFTLQHPGLEQKFTKGMALHEQGGEILKSLEADVQARLWNLAASPQ
jgi:hypothetical protein